MLRKRKGLGYVAIQRFVVDGCMKKRVYTNVIDALSAARHASKPKRNEQGAIVGPGKTCRVLWGPPGGEARIASCVDRKCRTPDDRKISMRKLYEAEQGARPKTKGGKRHKKGRSVPAKAVKTRLTQYERRSLRTKVKKASKKGLAGYNVSFKHRKLKGRQTLCIEAPSKEIAIEWAKGMARGAKVTGVSKKSCGRR